MTKDFQHPGEGAWLPAEVFDQLTREYNETWTRLAEGNWESNAYAFANLQNRGMLLKFFLEQAFGDGIPRDSSATLIERDSGGLDHFRQCFVAAATADQVDWIVWGLSFATLRFHLFPISESHPLNPSCVSPIMVGCMRTQLVSVFEGGRFEAAETQFANLDWNVIENRIACLEKPLDVFDIPID